MRSLRILPQLLLTLALSASCIESGRCETVPAVAEILGLKGQALIEAVEKRVPQYRDTDLSATDLLALLEKLAAQRTGWKPQPEIKDDPWYLYADLIGKALKKARGEELDRVAKASTLLPTNFTFRPGVFISVVSALAAREIETIRAENRAPLQLPITTTPPPDSLKLASAELREAWSYFHSVHRPHPIAKEPEEQRQIAFQKNKEKFCAVLNRVVLGETKGVLDDLALFRWDSWCGTGYEYMSVPLNRARWLVLVRERQLPEAVSAALELQAGQMSMGQWDDTLFAVCGDLFQACGLNAEKLSVGQLVSAFADQKPTNRGVSSAVFSGDIGVRFRELAAYGSDYGVHSILQLIALAPNDPQWDSIMALGILLKPKGYDHGHGIFRSNSSPFERRSSDPVSQDVQDEAVRILLHWLDEPGQGFVIHAIVEALPVTKKTQCASRYAVRSTTRSWK